MYSHLDCPVCYKASMYKHTSVRDEHIFELCERCEASIENLKAKTNDEHESDRE